MRLQNLLDGLTDCTSSCASGRPPTHPHANPRLKPSSRLPMLLKLLLTFLCRCGASGSFLGPARWWALQWGPSSFHAGKGRFSASKPSAHQSGPNQPAWLLSQAGQTYKASGADMQSSFCPCKALLKERVSERVPAPTITEHELGRGNVESGMRLWSPSPLLIPHRHGMSPCGWVAVSDFVGGWGWAAAGMRSRTPG
jgi:hypothetical protein